MLSEMDYGSSEVQDSYSDEDDSSSDVEDFHFYAVYGNSLRHPDNYNMVLCDAMNYISCHFFL